MPLTPGAKLGPYEVLAAIPTVTSESYKAADTRLNQTVILKLYPGNVWNDVPTKQRLELEIKALAGLKHPNICATYEVIHEDGADYLVTEYIEGETLAERLKRGPMDLEEVLKVAIAIADALDKAHRQGITHRGLNPSNIILAEDGAKLTEFGLARPQTSGTPVSGSQLSTRTAGLPAAGIPPSAAPYLAPEQFEGDEGNARTDIFAFGAVFYEMLTGRPAFEGKTPAMLLAAIQTVDPEPVSKHQPATPPALEYLVKRCLAKDPKQRLQSARDLVSQLQWVSEGSARIRVPSAAAQLHKRDRLVWAATAVLMLLILAMAPSAYRYFQGTPEPDDVRFIVSMQGTSGTIGGITGGSPPMVSPDGRWLAGLRTTGNNGGVFLLEMGSVTPKMVLSGHVEFALFWAPDSRSFAFFDDGKLKASDVSGAPPQTLCDATFPVGGGAWGNQGVIVFASGGVLYRVSASGGQSTQLTTLDTSLQETEHLAPSFLPDGRHYLYLAMSSQPANSAVYVGSIDSKERTRLFVSEAPAFYAAPGYVLFNRGNAVFAQQFDPNGLKLTGDPVRLPDAAFRLAGGTFLSPNETKLANFSVSQNGALVYRNTTTATPRGQQGPTGGFVLTWFDRSSQSTQRVGGPGTFAGLDIAPDGKRFAVHQHEPDGGDSWFFDAGRMQRLTFNTPQDNSMPIWSRDGRRIAFGSRRNGKWGLYVKASDGTGPDEMIAESDLPKMPMSWSPDGKLLVYWVLDPKTRGDLWMVPVQGERKPVALLQSPADESFAQVSPDGKWMAYQSDETGMPQIYIRPFPEGPGNKSQVSTEGNISLWPRWRGDGKELFFFVAPNVMSADIRVNGSSVQPGVPRILFAILGTPNVPVHAPAYHRYAVTPDGQRFLFPQPAGAPTAQGGLAGVIAANVDRAPGSGTISNPDAINVILNWTRALKQK